MPVDALLPDMVTFKRHAPISFVGAERELRDAVQLWTQRLMMCCFKGNQVDLQSSSWFSSWWILGETDQISAEGSELHLECPKPGRRRPSYCEVEARINSRPVIKASTPNHLLLLKFKPSLPPADFNKADIYSWRCWRQVTYPPDTARFFIFFGSLGHNLAHKTQARAQVWIQLMNCEIGLVHRARS